MKLLFQKKILSLGLRGGGGAGLCVPPRGFMGGVLVYPSIARSGHGKVDCESPLLAVFCLAQLAEIESKLSVVTGRERPIADLLA